jgi:hypothetical protein
MNGIHPHSTRPAERPEIHRGLPNDPPGLIDDNAEAAIAVVKRQPVETGVNTDAMFARRGDLARAKQVQHAIGFDIQASCDDRGVDVERPIGDLDILRRRGSGLSNSSDRDMASASQVSREDSHRRFAKRWRQRDRNSWAATGHHRPWPHPPLRPVTRDRNQFVVKPLPTNTA